MRHQAKAKRSTRADFDIPRIYQGHDLKSSGMLPEVERSEVEFTKTCRYCGKEYISKRSFGLYCSTECKNRARYELIQESQNGLSRQATCPVCGKTFLKSGEHRKYCSSECQLIGSDKIKIKELRSCRQMKKKEKKRPQPDMTLEEAAVAARKAGMSYGKWMALHGGC